jgi:hypothetical protein
MSPDRRQVARVRGSVTIVSVLLLLAACGGGHTRTPAENTACAAVLQDATAGLRTAEGSLANHDVSAVTIDFEAIASAMRDDIKSLPAGKVRTALAGWANDYDSAARVGPTTVRGTQVIKNGALAAGAVCGK